MRRLRSVTKLLIYYLVYNQLVSLFSSYCFALLFIYSRRSFCRIDRRRFWQPRGVLCWFRSSPCCSRYRPNASLYIFIIASTSSSQSYGSRLRKGTYSMHRHGAGSPSHSVLPGIPAPPRVVASDIVAHFGPEKAFQKCHEDLVSFIPNRFLLIIFGSQKPIFCPYLQPG